VKKSEAYRKKGYILVSTLIIILVLMIVGSYIAYILSLNFRVASYMKKEFIFFSGADGGVFAVAGWMAYYRRSDVPREVTDTRFFSVNYKVLIHTVRYPEGYRLAWKGMDVRLNSRSKNGATEVESIVFIPLSPANYGNE